MNSTYTSLYKECYYLLLQMAYQTFRQEYFQVPVVTRAYTTACVITTLAVVSMLYYLFINFCSQETLYECQVIIQYSTLCVFKFFSQNTHIMG